MSETNYVNGYPQRMTAAYDEGQDLCVQEKQSQVGEQLDIVEKGLAVCTEHIAALESRLSPILRLQPTTPVNDRKEPDMLVPVAERLRTYSRRLGELTAWIASIHERVEV